MSNSRLQKFTLNEILPILEQNHSEYRFELKNKNVKVKKLQSTRMRLIRRKKYCASCLVVATHFWLETSGFLSPHFNLYTINYCHEEVLMTLDHILPKSLGGDSSDENVQMLCAKCNFMKSNLLIDNNQLLKKRMKKDKSLFSYIDQITSLIDKNIVVKKFDFLCDEFYKKFEELSLYNPNNSDIIHKDFRDL